MNVEQTRKAFEGRLLHYLLIECPDEKELDFYVEVACKEMRKDVVMDYSDHWQNFEHNKQDYDNIEKLFMIFQALAISPQFQQYMIFFSSKEEPRVRSFIETCTNLIHCCVLGASVFETGTVANVTHKYTPQPASVSWIVFFLLHSYSIL